MIDKVIFNKSLTIAILFSILIYMCISLEVSQKWVHTYSTVSNSVSGSPADNTPWYADLSSDFVCSGAVDSVSIMERGDIESALYNQTKITGSIKGGPQSSLCYVFDDHINLPHAFVFKQNHASIVYDFDLKWNCATIDKLGPYLNDPLKPNNKEGCSCHCPMSWQNAKYTGCHDPSLTGTFSYVKGMPINNNATLNICHNFRKSGNSGGCFFGTDSTTDYYFKVSTQWSFVPSFSLKRRSYLESHWSLIIDAAIVANFSLSPLDPIKIQVGVIPPIGVSLITEDAPDTGLEDFVIFSSEQGFNDPEKIYVVPKDKFNDGGETDPNKLCSVKFINGQLLIDRTRLDDEISRYSITHQCRSAECTIQNPFRQLSYYHQKAFRLTEVLQPESFAFYPGESTLLKLKTEASFEILIEHFGSGRVVETKEITDVSDISASCEPSQNLDGFHCKVSFKSTGKGQVEISTEDSGFVLTDVIAHSGLNSYQIIVDPLYTSSNKTTLCALGSWSSANKVCQTISLSYNITEEEDMPELEDPHNDDSAEDKGTFSWKNWQILLLVIACLVVTIILLRLLWPCFRVCKRATMGAYHKTKELKTRLVRYADSPVLPVTTPVKPEEIPIFNPSYDLFTTG